VSGLDYDDDAPGIELLGDEVGNLVGHAFLHLGPLGDFLDDAGEFAESGYLSAGEIADVGDSHEGEEVVLAHAVETDVADEDDFVVAFLEDAAEMVCRRGVKTGEEFRVHAGDPLGGFQKAVAVWVFTDGGEDLAYGAFDAREIDGGGRFGFGGVVGVTHAMAFESAFLDRQVEPDLL